MLKDMEQVKKDIASGKALVLAGDEALLEKLPEGNWIGGTIPYFMSNDGGVITRTKIFVHEMNAPVLFHKIAAYGHDELDRIVHDAPKNGFTILIIPAGSKVHSCYAEAAPNLDGIFLKPINGWISGMHLDDLGKKSAKIFSGNPFVSSNNKAIAMHFNLPADYMAKIGIINLFEQGTGDVVTFPEEGFAARNAFINGNSVNFAHYLQENKVDTKLPLVADYCGANVNVSIQEVRTDEVAFYAPVFQNLEYRIARPVTDYVKEFQKALPEGINPIFSCNCILNFLYSELEGKVTEGMNGPVTFGEIAYQLLNQTLVYLEILKID